MKTKHQVKVGLFSLAACLTTNSSWANTIAVGPTRAYTTIQAAISAAAPGGVDTIVIDDGVYNENLNLDKAVTLVSLNGRSNVTIQGSEAQSAALGGGNTGTVCISASGVKIGTSAADGVTIRGYDFSAPGIEHSAVYLKSTATTGLSIIGNNLVADGESALLSEYGSTQGIEVAHNVFSGMTYVGTTVGGNSSVQYTVANVPRSMIYFGGACRNISFHDNLVTGSVGGPIAGGGGATYYNTGATLDCSGAPAGSGATISNNTFTIPSWASLRARGSNTTSANNIFDSTGTAPLVVGSYYEQTASGVYSGNSYLSGAGTSLLGGDGSSTVVLPGNFSAYTIALVSTPGGSSYRATGPDRTTYLPNQATATFDDQVVTLSSLTAPVIRPVPAGYATIQAAITAAFPGEIVEVAPGTYTEGTVTLNKALTLSGANAGIAGSASGRFAETILSSSRCLIAADNVVIDGFKFTGTPPGAVIDGINQNASHVAVRNNLFENVANIGIYLMGSGTREDWTISRNRFHGIGQADGTLGTGNSSAMNLWSSNGMNVTDNVIDTVDYNGLNLDTVEGATVTGNTFSNIGKTGLQVANACAGPILIEGNAFDGCNQRYALDQNYWYGAVKLFSSTVTGNVTIRNNELRNSVVGFMMARILGPSTNLVFENNILTGNSLGGFLQYWGAGQPVGLAKNYWGSPTGPAIGTFNNVPATPVRKITGGGSGDAILTALGGGTVVSFSPWYADAARTILRDGIFTNTTITTAQPSVSSLYVAPNTTVTVAPTGALRAAKLELADGAELIVDGGSLDLGQGSVISGSFTIFNSFGSWDINGDTTFNIGQSLALISDIHVAAGKTVTVNGGGELILDGCIIDSQTPGTPYNITAETDGLLTMARCVVTDANIDINTTLAGNLRSRIYDNGFTTSDIEASAAAKVYHNLFDAATDAAKNTDATSAFAAIDGWDNVTAAALLQNKFTLDFQAPADASRTLDAGGNLFVQPADAVVMKLDVAALGTNTITAAEALLGYNSGMLTLTSSPTRVTPLGAWEVIAETAPVPSGLGIVDSALGLQLNAGQEGISADSQVAEVNFTAGNPGLTLGFFRVQTDRQFNPDGTLVRDTRLTESTAGVPSLLAAFTANTGELVIDNQPPTIAEASANGTQVQANTLTPVDVLDPGAGPESPNYVFRNGHTVVLSFEAADAGLAGLETETAAATEDLALTASNGSTTLAYTVAASGTTTVSYTVTFTIPDEATTGEYMVTATLRDRSGNVSAPASLGCFNIANEVLATVELQGYGAGTRAVVFTATNGSGTALATWTKSVVFTGAVGSVPLEAVPAGTAAISAKTAWNLRSKLPVSFSTQGVSAVSLTGADKLPAGDLTGDNVVNTLDYSMLRYHWLTDHAVANLNGDAWVNLGDYNLLKGNFYSTGDPQ